jgi:ribosomal protein S18 acetylase RimI-like enzyme
MLGAAFAVLLVVILVRLAWTFAYDAFVRLWAGAPNARAHRSEIAARPGRRPLRPGRDPARRREGIGRTLLDATLVALAARGAPLVVSTAERNEAAQRLFASAGFRRTIIEMTRELGER